MGMGLAFNDLSHEQKTVLSDWLPHAKGLELAARRIDITESSNVSDRDLALHLVRQLRTKGILTESDWSELT
jgi:hypothetical protein